ncbi:hypothetical protein L1887_15412 [Cichorium endivia]|nr:hypothetical protein L1887_15412 [Cichorium endivia]
MRWEESLYGGDGHREALRCRRRIVVRWRWLEKETAENTGFEGDYYYGIGETKTFLPDSRRQAHEILFAGKFYS